MAKNHNSGPSYAVQIVWGQAGTIATPRSSLHNNVAASRLRDTRPIAPLDLLSFAGHIGVADRQAMLRLDPHICQDDAANRRLWQSGNRPGRNNIRPCYVFERDVMKVRRQPCDWLRRI